MKKFLLSIFAVMLAVFSVQAEEVTKSVTFSNYTAGTQYADNEKHDLGDGLVIYTTKCHFTTQLRIYSSSTNNGYVVSDALPGTITKMTFNAGYKVDKLDIYGSNDGANWTKVGQVDVTSTSYKDYSFNFTGSYNRFKLDVSGDQQIRIAKMSVTYTKSTGEGGGETPEPVDVAEPTFTPASGTTFEDELDITIDAEDGLTVHYSTDNKVSYTVGNAVNITETTTVYAYAEDADGNKSDVVSAEYTKVVPVDPNAKEVEATISFANTAQRLSQDSNSQVWSNGGVTFTNNKSASQNAVVGNTSPVRLYAGSELVIECASGNIKEIVFYCNTTGYASALKTSIGNAASVSGKVVTLTLDGSSNSYTVATLSAQVRMDSMTVTYLVSGEQAEKPAAPTFSVETGSKFYPTLELEISAAEGAVIYYTLNGGNPTTESAVYSTPITIEETTVVKAIAVIDGVESDVAAASYKKVIDSVTGNVADAFYYYVGGEQIPAVITGYIVGAVNGTSFGDGGENCKFDVTKIENAANILIADNADETDYTKCLVVQLPSGDVRDALNLVDNPDNLKKKVVLTATMETYFGVAGLKSTSAYEFVEEEEPVAETWSSFYAAFSVAIPEGIEAYIVTAANAGYVTLTQIYNAVPANTGVILKGGSIEATYDNYYSGEVTEVTGNLLQGTMTNTPISEEAYVLGKVDGVIGLYKAEMNQLDGTAWLNNANKAYLPASVVPASAQGAASFSFRFGEGTTGIENVEVENASNVIYDLTGRRVEAITAPGIYIVGGKKVLVK